MTYDASAAAALMREDSKHAALVRFNVLGGAFMSLVDDLRRGGPWDLPRDRVPELNRSLRGSVVIVAPGDRRSETLRG
ncbi:MAG TPA: hypothetical protein VG145_07095 [Xanthobacteraceae bacterium]|jgi:hypothetical protein|nr:hypothetical protein [Xanthobacteraceae bacterium]